MENLQDLIRNTTEARVESDKRLEQLTRVVERLAAATSEAQGTDGRLAEQIAYGQAQLVDAVNNLPAQLRTGDEVWDAEAKMRLRNIDTQLLRILEEMTSGRQDVVGELRSDLLGLTSTLRAALDTERGG